MLRHAGTDLSSAKTNPHFASAANWDEAAKLVDFEPLRPRESRGLEARTFAIHIRDHKKRKLGRRSRSLETHYGDFVFSQSRKGQSEARRWALSLAYGPNPRSVEIAGREGRVYPLGPEPDPDDVDPRMPAVVTWCDGELFYMIASDSLEADDLLAIARSCY